MSVLLLFPRCPIHSSSNPPVTFGDSPGGNLAAPPVPPPLAGAAFSPSRDLIETVSVLMGLWIAECALLFVFMGYVR
jgi:hypothetical protein